MVVAAWQRWWQQLSSGVAAAAGWWLNLNKITMIQQMRYYLELGHGQNILCGIVVILAGKLFPPPKEDTVRYSFPLFDAPPRKCLLTVATAFGSLVHIPLFLANA